MPFKSIKIWWIVENINESEPTWFPTNARQWKKDLISCFNAMGAHLFDHFIQSFSGLCFVHFHIFNILQPFNDLKISHTLRVKVTYNLLMIFFRALFIVDLSAMLHVTWMITNTYKEINGTVKRTLLTYPVRKGIYFLMHFEHLKINNANPIH